MLKFKKPSNGPTNCCHSVKHFQIHIQSAPVGQTDKQSQSQRPAHSPEEIRAFQFSLRYLAQISDQSTEKYDEDELLT